MVCETKQCEGCDITPLQKELGFEPDYPLEKGVYETVNWYKKSGWL